MSVRLRNLGKIRRGLYLFAAVSVLPVQESLAQGAPPQREASNLNRGGPWRELARSREARQARLASALEGGFGGFAFDAGGNIIVYLQDTTRAAAARAAIGPLIRDRVRSQRDRGPIVPNIVIRRGAFTFAQLSAWRDLLTDPLLDIDGVELVDLDEGANRITVGVSVETARGAVETRARDLGVPASALRLEQVAPFKFDVDESESGSGGEAPNDSITTYNRPVNAGMQIAFENLRVSKRGRCTMGPIVKLSGETSARHFLVNSHCTGEYGGVSAASFYQQTIYAGGYIAYEYLDPAYVQCGSFNSYRCRNSDAAAGRLDVDYGVPYSTLQFGYISRTTFSREGRSGVGSLEIDKSNRWLQITASGIFPNVNDQHIDKVGSTTGWTYGKLVQECATVDFGQFRFYCQDLATYGSDNGDSGSPVFIWNNYGSTASLVGIHVGTNGTYAVYSHMVNVEGEIPEPIRTF